MASSNPLPTRTCRKRRRSDCIHSTTYIGNNSKPSNAFIITLLLAALAVVVQGESRTLRHYREPQPRYAANLVRRRTSSRIEEQQIIRKTIETSNGETILSRLFDDPDDNKFNETYYHAIGQHADNKSQKFVRFISIETADTGGSNGSNLSEEISTSETVYYDDIQIESTSEGDETIYYDNIEMENPSEGEGSFVIKTLFEEPLERNVGEDYAIGRIDKVDPDDSSLSSDRDSICKDCVDDGTFTDGSVCSVPEYECCSDDDCIHSGDICSHRRCVIDAYFRFTLKWIGNDDYDLFVVTPDGAEISYENEYDPLSLGRFERQAEQEGYGYHVENIYFPRKGGPSGVYRFYVRPYLTVEASDTWQVTVLEGGNLVALEWGVGASESFFCKKDDEPRPTTHPALSPTRFPIESPTRNPILSPVLFPERPPLGQPSKVPVITPAPVPTGQPTNVPTSQPIPLPTGQPTKAPISEPAPVPIVPISEPAPIPIVTEPGPAPGPIPEPAPVSAPGPAPEPEPAPVSEPGPAPAPEPEPAPVSEPGPAPAPEPEPAPASEPGPAPAPEPEPAPVSEPGPAPAPEPEPAPVSEPGPAPAPEPAPTAVVQPPGPNDDDDDDCDATGKDECCVSTDCTNGNICEQRTCINTGNPRFTLKWFGSDSLLMYAVTPDGVTISANNTFDDSSGGTFEKDKNDPSSIEYRVQNIYFPIENSPGGMYEYLVREKNENAEVTSWTIESHDEDGLVETHSGSGNSETFNYFHRTDDNPTRPDQSPPACNLVDDECCIDNDCAGSSGDICIQRTCLNDGSFRVTLEWTGNDNLDLLVETPSNNVISKNMVFDTESGGRHESSEQSTFGFNVENVYFLLSDAPPGQYKINVDASAVEGEGSDRWTIKIYEGGKLVEEGTGFGDSVYSYGYQSSAIMKPFDLREGSPRFTLHWPGESFYSLAVITPDGTQISAFAPYDADSRGVFEGTTQQLTDGDDTESIYFPVEGGPPGMYAYSVTNTGGGKTDEPWVVTVYVDGENVALQTGSGNSDLFSFQFEGFSLPDNENLNEPEPTLCSTASDCLLSNTFCTKNICIQQGTPQFVLSWNGQSDLSLSVATPLKTIVSLQNPSDGQSGGTFEKYNFTEGSTRHIESIYFAPEQGPTGTYQFYIKANDNKGDVWKIDIFIDGEQIESYSGQGTSEVLYFDYSGNLPTMEPVVLEPVMEPVPEMEPCDQACCVDSDCLSNQICASNTCVKKGAPQFVLSWEGDYDLSLQVATPVKTAISSENPIDFPSGGKFEQILDFANHRYMENIFFAPNDGLRGMYPYYVQSYENGSVDDTWTLAIYIDGTEMRIENGKGSSELSFFDYTGRPPTMKPTEKSATIAAPTPVANPTVFPTKRPEAEDSCDPFVIIDGESLAITNGECCSDANCFPNESCTSRTCVDEGNPRFTLSWVGANDLDLIVVTPQGTIISYSNPEDPLSGGKFGEDYDQFDYGLHVENIYFPPVPGKPFEEYGEYSFYVRKAVATAKDDTWTVGVYVDGEQRLSVSGAGSSKEMKYNFSPFK